jgi:hypothetical protein
VAAIDCGPGSYSAALLNIYVMSSWIWCSGCRPSGSASKTHRRFSATVTGVARDENLFYGIVHDENSLTELLCNLLKFSAFRALFGLLISRTVGTEMPPFSHADVVSQASSEDGDERPDIVIESGDWFTAIESKIRDAALTRAQRSGYAATFDSAAQAGRYLVFLVPEGYAHLSEIDHLVFGDHRPVVIAKLFWSDMIEELQNSPSTKDDPILAEFLSLLQKWFVSKTIVLPEGGAVVLNTTKAGSSYFALLELIESVAANLTGTHAIVREINGDGYGFAVKDSGGQSVWFGVDYDFWKRTGYTLCVAVSKPRKVDDASIIEGLEHVSYQNDHWDIMAVPAKFYAGKENGRRLKELIVALSLNVAQ